MLIAFSGLGWEEGDACPPFSSTGDPGDPQPCYARRWGLKLPPTALRLMVTLGRCVEAKLIPPPTPNAGVRGAGCLGPFPDGKRGGALGGDPPALSQLLQSPFLPAGASSAPPCSARTTTPTRPVQLGRLQGSPPAWAPPGQLRAQGLDAQLLAALRPAELRATSRCPSASHPLAQAGGCGAGHPPRTTQALPAAAGQSPWQAAASSLLPLHPAWGWGTWVPAGLCHCLLLWPRASHLATPRAVERLPVHR